MRPKLYSDGTGITEEILQEPGAWQTRSHTTAILHALLQRIKLNISFPSFLYSWNGGTAQVWPVRWTSARGQVGFWETGSSADKGTSVLAPPHSASRSECHSATGGSRPSEEGQEMHRDTDHEASCYGVTNVSDNTSPAILSCENRISICLKHY